MKSWVIVAFISMSVLMDCHAQLMSPHRSNDTRPPSCSEGWWPFQNSCYGFSGITLSWIQAASVCTAHGSHLVEISSAEENSWIVNGIRSRGYNGIWIGASQLVPRGNFKWAFTRELLTFTDWASGQPDYPGGYEDCAEIRAEFGWKWNNWQCQFPKAFVCETP